MEGDYRRPQELADNTSSLERMHALMEGERLTFESPQAAYTMLSDLYLEANHDTAIPKHVVETIHAVSLAFGFLAYDHLRGSKQGIFLARLDAERENVQTDRLELSLDEADVLQRIAASVGIDYDPGTEETPEKRMFLFSRVESHPPQGSHDLDVYRLMTGREKPPEHDPIIVDSTSSSTSTES